ncbi:ATP-binding protein [Streptomyces bobili]|uniref:ATP-binding protein n=1 Tax=Streptomyces bobili TaxID=67280 RepID=UPI00381C426C
MMARLSDVILMHVAMVPDHAVGYGTADALRTVKPKPHAGKDRSVSCVLPHEARAARRARVLVARVLAEWAVPADTIDEAVLVASELVTNATEHANPPLVLQLHHTGASEAVSVAVRDGGAATTTGSWASSRGEGEHGRGLSIVEAVAFAHGTVEHRFGATRWALLAAGGGA